MTKDEKAIEEIDESSGGSRPHNVIGASQKGVISKAGASKSAHKILSQSSAKSFRSGSLAASSFASARKTTTFSEQPEGQQLSKKRQVNQITGSSSGGDGKKIVTSAARDALWIEKHAPTSIEELVVNKKKISEFVDIVE